MSRIINPDSAGKDRTRLSKAVVLSVRELARQSEPGAEARDLSAFIALALITIGETIEVSVAAWEKRGYWVKADRFRMEWAWAGLLGEKMKQAVLSENWNEVVRLAPQVAQKLSKVTVASNHRMGQPWTGAWQKLREGR